MTRADFDERRTNLRCRHCSEVGRLHTEEAPPPHAAGIRCGARGRHNGWIGKDENADKRPNVKSSVRDATWARYGDRCVHCGISAEHLELLGLPRTVQHCPPWKEAKSHDVLLLPYCEPCQSDSAVKMRRTETLVSRILDLLGKARATGRIAS